MQNTDRLMAIEAIKVLKAEYFRCLDAKDWAGWKERIFSSDATMLVPEVRSEPLQGIDAIVEFVAQSIRGTITVHHGHMPEIKIETPNSASAIWAMEDYIWWPKDNLRDGQFSHLHGYGHYHEAYTCGAQGWRIETLRLSRLHMIFT